ncbi:hypothetical protein CTheo_6061 [Ceratobasidium theobromae]|uniref:Laminin domain protein n=1 Tax=Ceratobasidium theobromae TaxID=1582974 RepID=A0A5N5QFU1_9AGAM|nr:hypothetical protein CTheo_6061 [Ceratobasidium theobromae]
MALPADPSINGFVYNPPVLPPYLAATHELKSITGVPTDEQVKAIHAVIRAVNVMSHIPALHDPDVSMKLGQHLFEVQMAVYRSTYPLNISPIEHTYTPPELPAHVPVALESVTGAPSDDELKSVQRAVRVLESLASSLDASIFDPDVSMKLSQHLFNIQFARYMDHSTQGLFNSNSGQPPADAPPAPPTAPSSVRDDTESVISEVPSFAGSQVTRSSRSVVSVQTPKASVRSLPNDGAAMTGIRITQDETNRLLNGTIDELKAINRTLIMTQNSMIRSTNSHFPYSLLNQHGELPSMYGLPVVIQNTRVGYYHCYYPSDLTDDHLAGYLTFYDLGNDMVDMSSGSPKLKPEKRKEAVILLQDHLFVGPRRV